MYKEARTRAPIVICFVAGIIMIAAYFIPSTELGVLDGELSTWGVILSAFALVLGVVGLYSTHIHHITAKTAGRWPYSIWLVIVMSVFLVLGVVGSPSNPTFRWLSNATIVPIESALQALLAFFILSAAYRALKARTVEGAVLLVVAAILTMTNAPIGEAVWGGIPVIGQWILDVPNTAASRGMILCVTLGTVALSIRTLLGYERKHLGEG